MSFSPGQFITAQRLNRLQTKTYWSAANGTVAASSTNTDIPGTSMNITIETDGATVAINWSTAFYAAGTAPSSNANSRAFWDVNASPHFALAEFRTANEKVVSAQNWMTTITTAGTYAFKIQATTPANFTIAIYSAIMVQVTEVV